MLQSSGLCQRLGFPPIMLFRDQHSRNHESLGAKHITEPWTVFQSLFALRVVTDIHYWSALMEGDTMHV